MNRVEPNAARSYPGLTEKQVAAYSVAAAGFELVEPDALKEDPTLNCECETANASERYFILNLDCKAFETATKLVDLIAVQWEPSQSCGAESINHKLDWWDLYVRHQDYIHGQPKKLTAWSPPPLLGCF